MVFQPALLKEEPTTAADARISEVIDKVMEHYGGDLGEYVAAVRRRNPIPDTEYTEDRFLVVGQRHYRRMRGV